MKRSKGDQSQPSTPLAFAARTTMVLLGVALAVGPCLWIGFVFSRSFNEDLADHRVMPENQAEAVRSAIDSVKLGINISPTHPLAERVSDGFHGDGCDWFACDLSEADVLRVAIRLASLNGPTTQPAKWADLNMDQPPTWWTPYAGKDLVRWDTGEWFVGLSASQKRLFLRLVRS